MGFRGLPALLMALSCGPGTSADAGSGTSSSSTGGPVESCALDLRTGAPSVIGSQEMPRPFDDSLDRVVAAPDGAFYGLGTIRVLDSSMTDVQVWRFGEDAIPRWSATWGDSKGWSEYVGALAAGGSGVVAVGTAGAYESMEYFHVGGPFARAYSPGGVVRWTWQADDDAPYEPWESMTVALSPEGHTYLVTALSRIDPGDPVLRVFRIDAAGVLVDTRDHTDPEDPRISPHAARVRDDGTLLVAGERRGRHWLAAWGPDGGAPTEWLDEDETSRRLWAADIGVDGAVAFAGTYDGPNGNDPAYLSLHAPDLTRLFQASFPVGDGELLRPHSVSVGCDGSATVSLQHSHTNGYDGLVASFDPDGNELWRLEPAGWGPAAISDDGIYLLGGYGNSDGTFAPPLLVTTLEH